MPIDPLTALGLAGNIVQFVDFTAKLVSKGYKLSTSVDGALVENLELETATKNLLDLNGAISRSLNQEGLTTGGFQHADGIKHVCDSCNVVASELIVALNRIKVQGKRRKWNSFRQALKTIWTRDKIQSLSTRLDLCRRQLDTFMLNTLREEISEESAQASLAQSRLLSAVLQNPQRDVDYEDALYRSTIHAHRGEVIEFSTVLTGIADKDRIDSLQTRLLHQLQYNDMADRQYRIAEAHKKTFRWIYEDDLFGIQPWSSFSEWLRSQDGLYWITGKAGSGKSTLMRYLYEDPFSQSLMQPWAGKLPLVICGFFFWNSGIQLQMSKIGLLRTLLYDALKQQPHLVALVFPDRWKILSACGGNIRPWTPSELLRAFKLLTAQDGISVKLCFFIDGLDEFDGDHMELIKTFSDAVSESSIKICVASRPWLVFEDAFSQCPSLLLQDLTSTDIKAYIDAELCQSARYRILNKREPEQALQLITDISNKASGVFLWVTLVTKSLLQGLTNADRIHELQKRLETIPSDLEELYEKILNGIEPEYFEQAAKIFRLVHDAFEPLSIIQMSFAEEGDERFVFKLETKPLDREERSWRSEEMRRRINSRCKGLLEVPLPHPPLHAGSPKVSYGSEDEDRNHTIPSRTTVTVPSDFERTAVRAIRVVPMPEVVQGVNHSPRYFGQVARTGLKYPKSTAELDKLMGCFATLQRLHRQQSLDPPADQAVARECYLLEYSGSRWEIAGCREVESVTSQLRTWSATKWVDLKKLPYVFHAGKDKILEIIQKKNFTEVRLGCFDWQWLPAFVESSPPDALFLTLELIVARYPRQLVSGLAGSIVARLRPEVQSKDSLKRPLSLISGGSQRETRSVTPKLDENMTQSLPVNDTALSARQLGCLEDEDIASGPKVEYLHRTVKDFLERPSVWSRITSASQSAFQPHWALCRSYIARLKSSASIDTWDDSAWIPVSLCVKHAAQAELDTGIAQIELLEELDTVMTLLTSTSQAGAGHWASDMRPLALNRVMTMVNSNFLSFAVQSHLLLYVKFKAETGIPLLDRCGTSLLEYPIEHRYSVLPNLDHTSKPDIAMARLLLQMGADPNHGHPKRTPWQQVLAEALKCSKSTAVLEAVTWEERVAAQKSFNDTMESWAQMVDLYLTFDADPLAIKNSDIANAIRETFSGWNVNRAKELERMVKERKKKWTLLGKYVKNHKPADEQRDSLEALKAQAAPKTDMLGGHTRSPMWTARLSEARGSRHL